MDHVTLAIIGPREWVDSVGKKTTETIFSVHNLKRDDRIVSIISPSKYPEKIGSLLFTLYLADRVYLKIDSIDRDLGEILIALDLMDKGAGFKSIDDPTVRYRFDRIAGETAAGKYSDFDPNPAYLRESLFEIEAEDSHGDPLVIIDQAFNVKGVGCVALGFVKSGTIKKHQELKVYPGNKSIIIRSIQIQDRDHTEAPRGSRVGLALKNISHEDLPRGTCLAPEGSDIKVIDEFRGTFRIPKLYNEVIRPGSRFHVFISLQMIPCEVLEIEGTAQGSSFNSCRMRLRPESPFWHRPDHVIGLVYLDSKSFRFFGSGEIL
ncbi:MAG: EF-Tu/IF-2/RF-3 family GTPase [Thermoplasmatota archaeon]